MTQYDTLLTYNGAHSAVQLRYIKTALLPPKINKMRKTTEKVRRDEGRV